ncbi:hypothetical protein M413DRAFT_441666 [Hebeloma cylindrosporum]|uniref:Uncharacterized protein n=1 Tax=Hebeloma cylindrosporum TaxID=76867 RepID=A0A0C3CR61_HEBCY|nr:hypothetical protein M413DRAFT_441666 [Hebeloma cylindrosporum h7]
MLVGLETPRPLPPARARRINQKTSSTPPPAYGSQFTFPTRRQHRQDILGSPMTNTFQMVGWDMPDLPESMSEPTLDDVSDRSREELGELLIKVDGILKERENELGITTAVCRGLYQNNVALKTKHQELLARFPTTPTHSTPSPEHPFEPHSRTSSLSMATSASDSALGLIRSPRPSLYRTHSRKISIASADISHLADQNAELLDKLEKLEAEATSADQAGRRELKRLEKEIAFLREALEKTQAKSEELEEKVQGAVVGEAWRRKKEREAKFKAMRGLGRDADPANQDDEPRNFAPDGSKFGGPSDAFTFFPTAVSPDPIRRLQTTDSDVNLFSHSEHTVISQLLSKVQELEAANTRILKQQTETANQLNAVQRETANITKVYECLADPDSIELELEDEDNDEEKQADKDVSTVQTIMFTSLKRDIENDNFFDGTCLVHPDFASGLSTKNRKTVMGLFDEPAEGTSSENGSAGPDDASEAHPDSAWTEGCDRSSWSSVGNMGLATPSRLSPLHFFSPSSQVLPELSPVGARPSLWSELGKDEEWGLSTGNHHLRTSSLHDISQFTVPPSPSPPSRTSSRRLSDDLDYDDNVQNVNGLQPLTPLFLSANSLQLSVEPPTPHKSPLRAPQDRPTASPRITQMSAKLRLRTNRWVERRARSRKRSESRDEQLASSTPPPSPPPSSSVPPEGIPQRLLNAVDTMIVGFDAQSSQLDEDVSASEFSPDCTEGELSPPLTPHGDGATLRLHDEAAGVSPPRQGMDPNQGFWLKAWLWLQFSIVIFVFLYAMAKRGPTSVLTDENRKAPARRRR